MDAVATAADDPSVVKRDRPISAAGEIGLLDVVGASEDGRLVISSAMAERDVFGAALVPGELKSTRAEMVGVGDIESASLSMMAVLVDIAAPYLWSSAASKLSVENFDASTGNIPVEVKPALMVLLFIFLIQHWPRSSANLSFGKRPHDFPICSMPY